MGNLTREVVERGGEMTAKHIRAAVTVAAVYGFFLLFAQFSFIELIRASGRGLAEEKVLLGMMALAGIVSGFASAGQGVSPALIRGSLVAAALSAAVAPIVGNLASLLFVATLVGSALGISTVCLAALLPTWCGITWIGLGTGIGYAICNLPCVFQQTPEHQSWIAAGLAILGAAAVPSSSSWPPNQEGRSLSMPAVVVIFTALVWMDSAAFFIIQHASDLKSGTWGAAHLWRNAAIHLSFAIISGVWLSHGGRRMVPLVAWVALAVASICVNQPSSRAFAGILYPAGVSFYSVALVAWPGFLAGSKNSKSAAWKAAWIFAIAGWFGSANGIGMAQTLQRVPLEFIVGAGLAVGIASLKLNRKTLGPVLALLLVMACGLWPAKSLKDESGSSIERGRQVYQSEGCIHCHSRYSRPGSTDELLWGPAPDLHATLTEKPVLIGNRRHGPDLTNVGARRSAAWLKAHFIEPRALSPGSIMPSYAHLFKDRRGDDLVNFLKQSGIETTVSIMQNQAQWVPQKSSVEYDPKAIYSRHCAVCHGENGNGNGLLANQLPMRPTDLRNGPFIRTQATGDPSLAIARVIKFGVVGSEMPGHETLGSGSILSLSEMLTQWRRDSANPQ